MASVLLVVQRVCVDTRVKWHFDLPGDSLFSYRRHQSSCTTGQPLSVLCPQATVPGPPRVTPWPPSQGASQWEEGKWGPARGQQLE